MNKEQSLKIFKIGEEILQISAKSATQEEFASQEIANIVQALNFIARKISAVGFAAPQIGYSKRIMIIGMEFDNPRRPNVKQFPTMLFVNPEITFRSEDTAEDWEGCASFDITVAYIRRPVRIRYKAQDINGNPIEGELSNFPARVFQHELDHLDGILMDSRAIETKVFDKERDKIISMKS